MAKQFSLAPLKQGQAPQADIVNVGALAQTAKGVVDEYNRGQEDALKVQKNQEILRHKQTYTEAIKNSQGDELKIEQAIGAFQQGIDSIDYTGVSEEDKVTLQNTGFNFYNTQVYYYQGRINKRKKDDLGILEQDVIMNSVDGDLPSQIKSLQESKQRLLNSNLYDTKEAGETTVETYLNTKLASIDKDGTDYKQLQALYGDVSSIIDDVDPLYKSSSKWLVHKNKLETKINQARKVAIEQEEAFGSNISNPITESNKRVDDLVANKAIGKDAGAQLKNKIKSNRIKVHKANAKALLADKDFDVNSSTAFNTFLLANDGDHAKAMGAYTKRYFKAQIEDTFVSNSQLSKWNTTGRFTLPDGSTVPVPDGFKTVIKETLEDKQNTMADYGDYAGAFDLVMTDNIVSGQMREKIDALLNIGDLSTKEGLEGATASIRELKQMSNINRVALKKVLGDDGYMRFKMLESSLYRGKLNNDTIKRIDDVMTNVDKLTLTKEDNKFFNTKYNSKFKGDVRFREKDQAMFKALKALYPSEMSNAEAFELVEDYRAQFKIGKNIDLTGFTGAIDQGVKDTLPKIIEHRKAQGSYADKLTFNPDDQQLYIGAEGNPYLQSLGEVNEAIKNYHLEVGTAQDTFKGTTVGNAMRYFYDVLAETSQTVVGGALNKLGDTYESVDSTIGDWRSNPVGMVPKELRSPLSNDLPKLHKMIGMFTAGKQVTDKDMEGIQSLLRKEERNNLNLSTRERRLDFVRNSSVFETKEERSAFMAQVFQESKGQPVTENLNYSEQAIISTFSKARFQGKDPKELARNPEELANTVYGGAWGAKNLGNTEPGDGWKYRGRGLIQITGKDNYKKYGKIIGRDLVKNPDLALDPKVAMEIALAYWEDRVQPNVSDYSDTEKVTKQINPGLHGLEDRKKWYNIYTTYKGE